MQMIDGIKMTLIKMTSVLLMLFISQFLFSQSLEERLSKEVPTCKTISKNSQHLISTYSISDKDSLQQVIAIWKRECGDIEPIRRLEILMDIYAGTFFYSTHENYIAHELHNFRNRTYTSNLDSYSDPYSGNYNDYLNLGGTFDQWTKAVAEDLLLQENDKNSESYLILLLFSEKLDLFYDELYKTEDRDLPLVLEYKDKLNKSGFLFYKFCVYVGVWNPMGKLKEHFEKSPQLGVGINLDLNNNYSVEIKGMFTRYLNSKELVFEIDDRLESVKSESGITLGINVARSFSLFQDRAFLDIYSGVNVSIIDSGIKEENATKEDGTEGAETINLEIGINFRKIVFKHKSIGVNVALNYAPYNLDSQLKTDVGSLYGQANLFFRF